MILRHDVDSDVDSAWEFFLLEKKLNIKSSFFFLMTSPFYNLFSSLNRQRVKKMAESGFDIGLHFDPLIYEVKDLSAHVRREARQLAFIAGKKVRTVSLHNPSLLNEYPLFPGFINAYDPAFFSDSNYLSDSCMDFRGKDPYHFAKKAAQKPVQIVLHTTHYTARGDGYPQIMARYVARLVETIEGVCMTNWKYREQMNGRQLWDVIREEQRGRQQRGATSSS